MIGGDGSSCDDDEGTMVCSTFALSALSPFSELGMSLQDDCTVILSRDCATHSMDVNLDLQGDAPSVWVTGNGLPLVNLRTNVLTVPAQLGGFPADVVMADLLNQPRAALVDLFTKKVLKFSGSVLGAHLGSKGILLRHH